MELCKPGSRLKEFVLMTVSVLIMVVGIYFFKFPNNFSFGGVTGFAVLLSKVTGNYLSRGNIVLITNMLLLVVGFVCFGKNFGIKTVYCSTLMSVALQVLEYVCPLDKPLTNQPMLELCYAVALPAIGAAILFNIDASSGGTDIIAMILRKYTDVNIGKALMYSDLLLTLGTLLLYDQMTGLLSLMGLMVKSLVIDSVIESINLCKYCNVICEHPDPICEYIKQQLNRSATVCDATGAYTGKQKKMVLRVVTRHQAISLKRYIKAVEPEAFVIMTSTSEIIGRGFRV